MKMLKISDTISFPEEFTTQTQAILAKKGVGKSYTASVQAEELLEAGQQIIVIDFTGVWWGLRSSASGKQSGYPILVLGGDHGDVPLEDTAGEVIADAVINDRFSAVLDLSLFRKGEMHRFLWRFLETLYRRNRTALHLFCDEADAYAPQMPHGEDARTLGAMDDIVRRGRIRGIGCTLITQRPASINKNVLTQCEILTCLRLVHPKDIKAIKDWVDVHADEASAKKMIADLPTLPVGTAWIWAPAWPDEAGIFERVKIRKRRTFDSGATPKPGEAKASAKVLAAVDVEKLGLSIKQTVEKVKANDPRHLQAEINRLQTELATKPTAEVRTVDVPILSPELAKLIETWQASLADQVREITGIADTIKVIMDRVRDGQIATAHRQVAAHANAAPVRQVPQRPRPVHQTSARPTSSQSSGNFNLGQGEKAILSIVAQYPDGVTRETITVMSGYKRSTRDAYILRLKQNGYVDVVGAIVCPTDDGVKALGSNYEPLPTGKALQAHWLAKLPEGERACLEVLIERYPNAVDREEISEVTGYKRSSRDTYLQRLKSRMLIVQVGRDVRAVADLF